MHKMRFQHQHGFTIVELLVVIVVIGILAAITIVSYTGIVQKATVASIQSDLSSSSQKLKMYYTENGSYPTSMSYSGSDFCPTPTDAKYCLRASAGNTYSYSSFSPSTFNLTVTHGTTVYAATESTSPSIPQPIFTSGGTIVSAAGTRTHTFGPGTYSLTTAARGTITVTIKGAGGGGGSETRCASDGGLPIGSTGSGVPGASGALSSFTYGAGTWTAYGGAGGGGEFTDCWTFSDIGSIGTSGSTQLSGGATMSGWMSSVGGGSAGGARGGTRGGLGGNGGLLTGSINVTSGQSVTVVSGLGGAGGVNPGVPSGSAGANGVVTISYPY